MWGTALSETPEGGLVGRVNGEGLYEGDQFWADAIKDTYDDPTRRLAMAKRNLPLPAAFREASIALRAIIRTKRKTGTPFEAELSELHRLAAIASLAPYDPLDITPFAEIEKLDLAPSNIGWDELPLLNKTDQKWMAEAWPSPKRHVTGESVYPDIHMAGRAAAQRHNDVMLQDVLARVDALPSPQISREEIRPERRSFWSWLLGR
ncbi:MAG TPA: hypothetical protein VKC17_05600 [Sphingomicrobium sp.]|nr:hypothetical protein [Sphingomicrobium sp.]